MQDLPNPFLGPDEDLEETLSQAPQAARPLAQDAPTPGTEQAPKLVKLWARGEDLEVLARLRVLAKNSRRSLPDYIWILLGMHVRNTQPPLPTVNQPQLSAAQSRSSVGSQNSGGGNTGPAPTPIPEKKLPAPGSVDELLYPLETPEQRMEKGYSPTP